MICCCCRCWWFSVASQSFVWCWIALGTIKIARCKTNYCRYIGLKKNISKFFLKNSISDSFLLSRPSADERKRAAREEKHKEKAATLRARREAAVTPRPDQTQKFVSFFSVIRVMFIWLCDEYERNEDRAFFSFVSGEIASDLAGEKQTGL